MAPVVCQLVHGLPVGGTEVLVDRLTRSLADRYQFEIVCLDEVGELGQQLIADGFTLHELGRRPGFDWACVRRLARRLQASNVSVVHAHQYTPFAYVAATRLFGKRPQVLFTEHGRFYPDLTSAKRRWFNRVITSRRDRLVAVGDAVRQALIQNEGLPGERIEIIYNGVRTSPVNLTAVERSALRRELGAGDDEFIVIQVARLDSIKDHCTALNAISLATGQQPAVRLALVGDGPEKAHIEQLIAKLGLQQRVRMLGQRRDVPELLAAADAFLLSSLSEGIPVTIIEAMAAGLPVASTKVGGVPEVIDDEVTGLLAPPGDAPKLAAAIVRLASDVALRTKLAANGKVRAESRFSETEMVQRYDRIYAEMICEATGAIACVAPIANGHEDPTRRGSASELLT